MKIRKVKRAVKRIIKEDRKFTKIRNIKIDFYHEKNYLDKAFFDGKINLNLNYTKRAVKKYLGDVEFTVLHEIRHAMQYAEISSEENRKYKLVRKWKKEFENYKSYMENTNSYMKYLTQEIEMDANAFALAVLCYKYRNVSFPNGYKGRKNNRRFKILFNIWFSIFKENIK